MRRGRTAHTITVPPSWLLSEERGASSLSLPLTSRISARARARRAYAHVRVPPGRDGAALCTAQRTKYCDDTQKKNQTKKTVATERARPQTKGGGTRIRISARAYADVHVRPGQEGAALCPAQRTGSRDSTQKKNQMKMAFATERAPPQTRGGDTHIPEARAHVRTQGRAPPSLVTFCFVFHFIFERNVICWGSSTGAQATIPPEEAKRERGGLGCSLKVSSKTPYV